MKQFAFARAAAPADASRLVTDDAFALPVLKAGGMDVVDLMKEGILEPDVVIDVRRASRSVVEGVDEANGRVRLAAGATLAELDRSDVLRRGAPVVAQAAASAATPQVRNVASVAGNLLQRPRCWYFRNETFDCLKKGGHTCYAVEGDNRYHAIFGDGPCHIVHPSNLAPALMVTDGVVHLAGGDRAELRIGDFYHMPDRGIRDEAELRPGEFITHVSLAPAPTSGFYAVKAKQSFDWPLVFACVALDLDGSVIRGARVCAGAVAPTPWPLPKVAAALRGVSVDDDDALAAACAGAANGAKPMRDNAYKSTLLPVAVRRAVRRAAGREEIGA